MRRLVVFLMGLPGFATVGFGGPPGTAYLIGSPTAKEQLYVELINRARANPTPEGIRLAGYQATNPRIASAYSFFNVNLALMQAEFVTGSAVGKPTLQVAPPLSINSKLTAAARLHSQDQITWDFQGHIGHNGSTSGARITAQGFTWSASGENVFASSASVLFGHAGFQVDWGGNDGTGMQGPPRGHRQGIHSTAYREIGVGNLTSLETSIPASNSFAKGPEVVTQDLATASVSLPFVTGVVYYDLNANSFYDPGEGIGGVEVGAVGTSFKGVTAASGGYSIPVPGNGTYPLTFWFPGAASASYSTSAVVSNSANVKVDWTPAYPSPTLSGSGSPAVGVPASYSFAPVGGAVAYDFRVAKVIAAPAGENADSGTSGYSLEPDTAGYLAVESGGVTGNCFHFGHNLNSSPTLTLNRLFWGKAGASISFKSKLGYATPVQIARLQVRPNGGTWTTLWSQAGSNGPGESAFNLRSQSLAAYAGQELEFRFVYEYVSGSYYPGSASGTGWFLDDITFSGLEELSPLSTTSFAGSPASFTAAVADLHRLNLRPRLADPLYQNLPWSPALDVTAITATTYASWVASQYPTVTGGAAADHDRDGIPNGVEFAFGLDPTVTTPHTALPQGVAVGGSLGFNYTSPAGLTGVTYGAQWSADLTGWSPLPDTGSDDHHAFSVAISGKPRVFLRHQIVIDP
ncbi:MAG: CAP domain-containing protein [Akkermansiaceae bacterium]|nr:CAP domain-containing protein [Akkermansiaceae bacterium]MCF7734225.1 CAP domain-containing protein [Akkermansiaceae bacterium]